jgi:hypothetical protein
MAAAGNREKETMVGYSRLQTAKVYELTGTTTTTRRLLLLVLLVVALLQLLRAPALAVVLLVLLLLLRAVPLLSTTTGTTSTTGRSSNSSNSRRSRSSRSRTSFSRSQPSSHQGRASHPNAKTPKRMQHEHLELLRLQTQSADSPVLSCCYTACELKKLTSPEAPLVGADGKCW